uniref:Polyprotein n=1 Tax=Peronospora matthiolae TaxID=2874970 RepID=A0AAV1U6D5_9STRA
MHNRVQLRRQLHEFKLAKGGSIMDHFLRFDELCMTMQAVGQEISQDEHLVILLGSLTRDYDPIVKIIENMPGMTLFHAKEMLRREYDGMARTEHQEIALKSTHTSKYKKGPRRHMGRSSSRGEKFSEGVTDVTNMGTSVKIARLKSGDRAIWRRESIYCVKSDVS